MARGVWTCRKQAKGVRCGTVNSGRLRKCTACGKPRPVKRKPAHMAALEITYEDYIALNGGEVCGICGRLPGTRKLDRDHDHATGKPRGLLCWRCNRLLVRWLTPTWLRAAANYLERASG